MDVIKSRREERIRRSNKLKATIEKAFNANLTIDKEFLVAQACLEWGVSRRTILEQLDILRISMGFTIENKQITPPAGKDEKEQGSG